MLILTKEFKMNKVDEALLDAALSLRAELKMVREALIDCQRSNERLQKINDDLTNFNNFLLGYGRAYELKK
jgi:hypothetical protein